ncbi:MAG: hypothetical protein R3B72_36050 [Polyangiaceae bacterium]
MSAHEPTITHADAAPDAEQEALDVLAVDYFADDPFPPESVDGGVLVTEHDFGPEPQHDEPARVDWIDRLDVAAIPELRDQRDRLLVDGERVRVSTIFGGEVQSEHDLDDAKRAMVRRAEEWSRRDLRGSRLAFRTLASTTVDGLTYLGGELVELLTDDGGPRPVASSEQGAVARRRGERRPRREVVHDLRELLRREPDNLIAEAALLALEER